ncbi:MAG TPA: hypothetical protein VFL98_03695 [Candidatus Paceibacterota bacterium]|nr:hypothetical protein [Candidatus Paceibacterota bacterium]
MDKRLITFAVIAFLIGAAAGFGGSRIFAMRQVSAARFAAGRAFGGADATGTASMRGSFGARGGIVTGTVLSKDSSSITVATQNGSSLVLYGASTGVSKSVSVPIADVAIGARVSVTGPENSDGSVTAAQIQLLPATTTSRTP